MSEGSGEGHRTKTKQAMNPQKSGGLGKALTRGQRLAQQSAAARKKESSPKTSEPKLVDSQSDSSSSSEVEDQPHESVEQPVLMDQGTSELDVQNHDSYELSDDSGEESEPSEMSQDKSLKPGVSSEGELKTHMCKGHVCVYDEYGQTPVKLHHLLRKEGVPVERVKHITFADLKVLDPTVTLAEYTFLKESVEFSMAVKAQLVTLRKHPMAADFLPAKRQDLKTSPGSDSKEHPEELPDPYKGFIRKVPTSYPAALPEFDSLSKTNPDFWFQGFENTLKSLQYHPVTWTALLRMAVAKDANISMWVQTLTATQVVGYDTLKRHLVSSFQTPVQAEKAYKELLRYRMRPNDRTIQTALDYNAGFGMHMLRAGKSVESWTEWRYHYREGLEQPWKEKFAVRMTEEGDPKDLMEAYDWLVGIGRVLEAADAARPSMTPSSSSSSSSSTAMQSGIRKEQQASAVKPAVHIATPEEVASRWCAWHGNRGHRTETCSHFKRWLKAWEAEGKYFTSHQKQEWLRWMDENKSLPMENPPNFDPNRKIEPKPITGGLRRDQMPRRDRYGSPTACYRCGRNGHTAAHCMAAMPMHGLAPMGRPHGQSGYPYGLPPTNMDSPPYGLSSSGRYAPPSPGPHKDSAPTSFAHPGSGRKPPFPLGPSPPTKQVSFQNSAPGSSASGTNAPRAHAVHLVTETSGAQDDPAIIPPQETQSPMGLESSYDDNPDFTKEDWNYLATIKTLGVRRVDERGLYEVEGLVANRKIKMQLDPGASHSILSLAWARENGLEVSLMTEPLRGVVLGEGSHDLEFPGYSQELHISCEGNEARHKFLLGKLKPQDPQCLIGDDLLCKLGYYISNVRFKVPDAIKQLIPDNQGPDSGKDDLRTRACTPHPERDRILRAVDHLLDKAEAVRGFCHLKEAVVEVPIPDEMAAPYIPQYPIPKAAEEKVEAQLESWAESGRIVPATDAEGNNPLTAASKRHAVTGEKSEVRTCLDIRAVNRILMKLGIKVPNNLPKVKDIFARLANKKVISVLDVADAFPSMPVSLRSRRFFRFTWKGKRWEFAGAPFGLLFLTAQFQHLMMIIFLDDTDFVIIFVDDLIVFSDSVEEHIIHLQRVLSKLIAANLRVRRIKNQIGFIDVFLLGHKAGLNGIETDQRKLMGMANWPKPEATTIEHYLGLFNYFREFIPKYAENMAPLEMVRKNFSWGPEQDLAWENAKTLLSQAPVLHYPDWSKRFYLGTDGSSRAVSVVLFQAEGSDEQVLSWVGKNNNFLTMSHKTLPVRIIAFASRATTGTEKWYSAYKLELLAVVFGLDKLRNYLVDREFILFTDQRALVWLFREQKLQKTNRMIQQWLDELLEYKFEAIHCPGVRNVLPDVLTRIYPSNSRGGESLSSDQQGSSSASSSFKERSSAKPMFEPIKVRLMDLEKPYDLSPLDQINWREHPEFWASTPKVLQDTLNRIFGRMWDACPVRPRVNSLEASWKAMNYVYPSYENEEELLKWFLKASEEAIAGVTSVFLLPKRDDARWYQCLKTLAQRYEFVKQGLTLFVVTPRVARCLKHELKPRLHSLRIKEKVMRTTIDDPELQRRLIMDHHERSHQGTRGVFLSISDDGFVWPNMLKQINEVVAQCQSCHLHTLRREGFHPMRSIEATYPMDHIAIDNAHMPVDVNGYAYVLVIVDICTRFIFLRALKDLSALTIARKLFKLFCEVGFPRIIQSDNGSEFRNALINQLTKLAEVNHRFSTPYHPQGNGSAEAGVKRMKEILRKKLQGNLTSWREHLSSVQYGANLRVMTVHKSKPFTLFFAREANVFKDYSTEISRPLSSGQLEERLRFMTDLVFPANRDVSESTHEKLRDRFLRGASISEIPEGAMVMTKVDTGAKGLRPRYEGPYKVVRRTQGGTYVLAEGDGTVLRRNYSPNQLKMIQLPTEDLPQTYEVESILDTRKRRNGVQEYLVKWRGYSSEHNSWEPAENFQDVEILTRFHENQRILGRA
jgi:transposase InsO family protein